MKGSKDEMLKYDMTAWYCPEIPINIGPNQYNGFPGLIFELQTKSSTFIANFIDLDSKETFDENELRKATLIDEYDYNLQITKILEEN